MRIRLLSMVVGLLLLGSSIEAGEKGIVIDNFEKGELSGWRASSHYWADNKPNRSDEKLVEISLNKEKKYIRTGKGSLCIKSWPVKAKRKSSYVIITKSHIPSPAEDTDTLSFWAYGEGDKGHFDLYFFNSKTWKKIVISRINLGFTGWKHFTFYKDEFKGNLDWKDINYLQLIIFKTNSTFYLDDIKFISQKSLLSQTKEDSSFQEDETVVFANFGEDIFQGISVKESSSGKISKAIKAGRKCLRLSSGKNGYKRLYLDIKVSFLPGTGPVLIIVDYFDNARRNIYFHLKGKRHKEGREITKILGFGSQNWKKEILYFEEAEFKNQLSGADLRICYGAGGPREPDLYICSICIKKLSRKEKIDWENFDQKMGKAAKTYGELVVEEARLRDEERQLRRAKELLGKENLLTYQKDLAKVNKKINQLYKEYKNIYYKKREKFILGKLSSKEIFSQFDSLSETIRSQITSLRNDINKELKEMNQIAKKRYNWFKRFVFEYKKVPPLERDNKPIPKELFGKRFFLGAPNLESYKEGVEPLGLEFTNRGLFDALLARTSPSESKFDFSKYGEMADYYYQEKGIYNTVFPVYAGWCWMHLPGWFKSKYGNEIYPVAYNGHIGKGGGNIFHPAVRKLLIDHATALGKYLKDKPYVFMTMILGEAYPNVLGAPEDVGSDLENGYSPIARKKFKKYLKDKYQTIENLNKQWGSNYISFEKIEPPKCIENRIKLTPIIYEFESFRVKEWKSLIKDIFETLKKNDPTHYTCTLGYWLQDDEYYPDIPTELLGGGFGMSHDFQLALARCYSLCRFLKNPDKFGSREFNVFADEGRSGAITDPIALRHIVERGFWQSAAWGVKWMLLYSIGGGNSDNILVTEMNSTIIKWPSGFIPLMRDKWNRLSKVYSETKVVKPDILVIESDIESTLLPYQRVLSDFEFSNRDCRSWHRYLFKNHYPVFITKEKYVLDNRENINNYKIILLGSRHLKDGLEDKLLSWVKRGGRLILSGPAGIYDKFGRYNGKLLKKVFGIERIEYAPEKAENLGIIKGSNINVDISGEKKFFHLITSFHKKPGVKVIAVYKDNSPAILKTKYGKGSVCFSLFPVSRTEKLAPLFISWVSEILPVREVTVDAELIEPVLREDKEGNRYLCLTNVSAEENYQAQIILDGYYKKIVDLGIGDGIPIKPLLEDGLTIFERSFEPGEGTVIYLGKKRRHNSPTAQAKAAKVLYLQIKKKIRDAEGKGINTGEERILLSKLKSAISHKKYTECQPIVKKIEEGLSAKMASGKKERFLLLAKKTKGDIETSEVDKITRERAFLLYRIGLFAGEEGLFSRAEEYMRMAKGVASGMGIFPRRNEIELKSPYLKKRPKIDGNLNDWKSSTWASIPSKNINYGSNKGDDDISGIFTTGWDKAIFISQFHSLTPFLPSW